MESWFATPNEPTQIQNICWQVFDIKTAPKYEELVGYSEEWTDSFSERGIRFGYLNAEDQFVSHRFVNSQDSYVEDDESYPQYYMCIPPVKFQNPTQLDLFKKQ